MKKFKVFALVFAIMLSATGLGLLFGSNQPASTQAKVSAEDATNTITVTFDAGAGSFGDGTKQNVATYKSERKMVTKYSHTSNIDDAGVANSKIYDCNLRTTDTVTIPGATSIQIDVWYSTESTSFDWLAIYPKGVTPDSGNSDKATISSGKLGDGREYEKKNATHKTFTVNDDTAIFYFQSDSSSCYYGYYAVVSGEGNAFILNSGEVKQPTTTKVGYFFVGWTDDANNQNVVKYAKDLSDFISDKDVTLYAVYGDWTYYWDYTLDNTANTISLTKYKGAETTYTVPATATIDGKVYSLIFGSGSPKTNTTQVDLGTITSLSFESGVKFPEDSSYMFYGSKLTSLNLTGVVDTSNVTNMSRMFSGCKLLTSLDLSGFNTSQVKNMDSMFSGCSSLTSLDLSNFDTSKVTDMRNMFSGCSKLTSITFGDNFDTSNVTNMGYMFYGCSALTSLDLSKFDTSEVTNMYNMFYYCSALTSLDLSKFDTSNVTNMTYMFNNCSALTSLDLSNFDTSKVTNMSQMFYGCSALASVNLSGFNTSKVTNMSQMFYGCSALASVNLSGFNTSKVSEAGYMFSDCDSLQNIKMPTKMNADSNITLNDLGLRSHDADYHDISWYSLASGTETRTVVVADNKVSNYAGNILTIDSYKSFNDINKDVFGVPDPANAWWSEWSYAKNSIDHTIKLTAYNGSATTYTVPAKATIDGKEYSVIFGNGSPSYNSAQADLGTITSLSFEKGFILPTDCSYFFACLKLTSLDLSGVDTSKVTNVRDMFYDCSSLTSLNLSGFNTSNVTSMYGMFSNCSSLTSLDLSSFNTSKVTNMSAMFTDCSALTSLNLSNFDTSKVTEMIYMFNQCHSLISLNLNSFNTSIVTDMRGMFKACRSLTSLDLNSFDTSEVISMCSARGDFADGMFTGCSSLTSAGVNTEDKKYALNFGNNFDTSKIKAMNALFYGCSSLESIDLSRFNTSNTTAMDYMFSECSSLASLDLSSFDASNLVSLFHMLEDCKSLQNIKMPNKMKKNLTTTLSVLSLPSQNASGTAIAWYSLASGAKKGTAVVANNSVSTYAGNILTIDNSKSFNQTNKDVFGVDAPAEPETPSTGVVLDVVLPAFSIVLVLASLVVVAFVGKKKRQY
jgi:uncharacterized repeat protein (TIGR02543 family)